MAFLETLALLIISLVVLAKSAQYVISSSLELARFFSFSELAVGFVLLSVATSLPEFAVGVIAGINNEPGISVGNVFGSNLADIGLVLGAALVAAGALSVRRVEGKGLVRILFATSLIPLLMLVGGEVRFLAGFALLAIFLGFVYYIFKERIVFHGAREVFTRPTGKQAVLQAFLFAASLAVLILSANYSVEQAVEFALLAGISKTFVGATAVALGTSLPELVVTLEAVRRKKPGIAWGTAVGSTITNLTLVLGSTLVLSQASVNLSAFLTLVVFALVMNLALWYFLSERLRLTRREGLILIGIYFLFLIVASKLELGF